MADSGIQIMPYRCCNTKILVILCKFDLCLDRRGDCDLFLQEITQFSFRGEIFADILKASKGSDQVKDVMAGDARKEVKFLVGL